MPLVFLCLSPIADHRPGSPRSDRRENWCRRVCTLLDKPSRRKVDVGIDYYGFIVEDRYVVGYGLDYAGRYRSLPFIGVLKPEVYGGG